MKISLQFLFLFVLLSCSETNKNSLSYISIDDINPSQRKIVDFTSETIYLPNNIYDPGYFDVLENQIFIIDFETLEIYRGSIDSPSDFTKIAGQTGRGPGEFERISGIEVTKERILIADGSLHRINLFNLDGNYINSIDVGKHGVYRFLELENGNLVLLSPLVGEDAIKVIGSDEQEIYSLINKKTELSPLVYTGSITSDPDNNIYYAGFSEPVLLGFDSEGKELFSVDVVNSFSSETNYVTFSPDSETRAFRYSPTAEFYTNSLAYFNGYLYSLVKRLDEKFVDIYNAESGQYIKSLLVDDNASIVHSDGKNIFISNKSLPRYNIQIIKGHE